MSPNEEERAARLVESGGAMVQPFREEVLTQGEWSLVFFAGQYSRAVLKRPAAGGFRVQGRFGGSWEARLPPEESVVRATAAIRGAMAATRESAWPLYARGDGIHDDQRRFLLMELELIEPVLFFAADAKVAPGRFARALLNRPSPARPPSGSRAKAQRCFPGANRVGEGTSVKKIG